MPRTALPARPAAYTRTAIALHWLLAAALIASFAVGVTMVDLPMSPQRGRLFTWHKWAGIVILGLSVARLAWRLVHRPPEPPTMPGWQRSAATATHIALYLLCIAVPLVGWAYSSSAGFPVVLFGVLPLPDFVPVDKALSQAIKPWHGRLAWTLAALVVLHVAAALKHHFIDRDGLLSRMWPVRPAS